MNKPSATLMVALFDRTVCVKISGRANFTSSLDLRNLVTELHNRGYRRFVLDLSECILMDSTFLGVLAGIGLKFAGSNGEPNGQVQLLNPNPRITDLLENLGVSHLFQPCESMQVPDNFQAVPSADNASRAEVTRTCLEAHQTLMNVNPENIRKFKDVAEFLAEDLKKIEHADQKPAQQ